jgi:hypothetical protein
MTNRHSADFLFVLCDISGYTRFMTEHREALFHAYVVISELMRAVLGQSKAPLRVMKLEGDAVFLYAVHGARPTTGVVPPRAQCSASMEHSQPSRPSGRS